MTSSRMKAYQRYISSAAWKAKRLLVLERDNNHCMICGVSPKEDDGLSLQVHHNSYEGLGDEPLHRLVTLCTHCHPVADQLQKKQRDRLGLSNQVRMNPSEFCVAVEEQPIRKSRSGKRDDVTKIASSVDRRRPPVDAQRPNSRSFESLLKGYEGH